MADVVGAQLSRLALSDSAPGDEPRESLGITVALSTNGMDTELRRYQPVFSDLHPTEQPQRDSNPCLHLERVAGAVREFAEMASDQGFEHSAIRVVCHRFATSDGHRRTKLPSQRLDVLGPGSLAARISTPSPSARP